MAACLMDEVMQEELLRLEHNEKVFQRQKKLIESGKLTQELKNSGIGETVSFERVKKNA